tara:strand:+ start:61 stop:519 length:459 start_codon:yes stop_codon:yes gene_type:complete
MNIEKLREQLKIDEGVKYEIYEDHLGYKTFGIGHLVKTNDKEYGDHVGTPVSEERVNSIFDEDVIIYINESKKVFGNLEEMPEDVQRVIVNMCFNMGAPKLLQFKKFIKAISNKQWIEAAAEMMDSKWAQQVGDRAERLKEIILSQVDSQAD